MKKQYLPTILVLFIIINLPAQQIGSWRLHFNYNVAKDLAYSDTKIFSATNESILVYNLEDNSTRELDKSNSLSDIGISQLAYCKDERTFIVAYNSTNIDLISENLTITNIPDIKNKAISTSKNINNIFIFNSKAFLATDIGIVVLDIPNQEIDNTFIIGNDGNPIEVLDCAIFKDTIYALTKGQGVKTAPLDGVNLLDFSSWQNNQIPMPVGVVSEIEVYNEAIYVSSASKIYKRTNANWELIFDDQYATFVSLKSSEKLISVVDRDSLGIELENQFVIIDDIQVTIVENENSLKPLMAIQNNATDLYIADLGWGLIDYYKNQRLSPKNKPFSSDVFSLSSRKDKVFAASGTLLTGIVADYNVNGFYYFRENQWYSVNRFNTSGLANVLNFLDVKENPINGSVYAGTTSGLVVYDYENIEVFDTINSLLEVQTGGSNIYVVGIDFDSKENVWMVNSHTSRALKVMTKSGDWYSYPLITGGDNQKYRGVFVDSRDQVWVSSFRNGIALFPNLSELAGNHDNESIALNSSTANLPHNNVNVIAEDKNGSIWLGTDQGIAVFDCPEDIFEIGSDCIVSRRIKSTLDDYVEYLFDTDVVKAITVDGANRKWVGTTTGVWLVSESGEDVIFNFNTENSPLPSNEILSISVNEYTGEVFIGTSEGIASYIGDATEPSVDISNIKAFPNPVHPEYQGTISVTGLVANSYIKITDIAGTLIDDGYALGGKYAWDGKDYKGRRASTGVYLIFSSDNDNKNKAVAKVVFIN